MIPLPAQPVRGSHMINLCMHNSFMWVPSATLAVPVHARFRKSAPASFTILFYTSLGFTMLDTNLRLILLNDCVCLALLFNQIFHMNLTITSFYRCLTSDLDVEAREHQQDDLEPFTEYQVIVAPSFTQLNYTSGPGITYVRTCKQKNQKNKRGRGKGRLDMG